jgi:hypothetical protein
MNFICALLFVFSISIPALAQTESSGAKLLFKEKGIHLTASEKRQIFQHLGVKVAPDGQSLIDADCGKPASFFVDITDLNNDRTPEVVVLGGNTCTSGATGGSIWLFIKDAKGTYRANLGFPAAGYEATKHRSKGYPDLLISWAGLCSAVWRWDGIKYRHYKNVATATGGCDGS